MSIIFKRFEGQLFVIIFGAKSKLFISNVGVNFGIVYETCYFDVNDVLLIKNRCSFYMC